MLGSLEGRRIGPYLIVSTIGRGGMGEVYLARHERLDRDVALKVLRPEFAGQPQLRERFIREARAAARLEHPNIVTVYDAGEDDGLAYFAMQYVEGRTLADLIRTGECSQAAALQTLKGVAAALDRAHDGGMVHRDVKPANIIITLDGRPMLTDFGIVHLRPESQLTMTGQLVGTPAYMAPEQVTGGLVTAQTDIYQLGVIAYELLSGELPFASSEPAGLLVAHLQEPPTPIHERDERFPPTVSDVLARALHKIPSSRFETATGFVEELETALMGPTTVTGDRTAIEAERAARADAVTAPAGERADGRWRWSRRSALLGGGFLGIGIIALAVATLIWGNLISGGVSDDDDDASVGTATGVTGTPTAPTAAAGFLAAVPGENSQPPPGQGEVLESHDAGALWPSDPEGVEEFEDDGSPRMRFVAPDVSVTKLALGAQISDGSAYLELSMLSVPQTYVELCLISRATPEPLRGYVLCLNSSAETFAYYVENGGGEERRVELMEPMMRSGTLPPNDWNELEIRSRGDALWFMINDQLLGAVTHDGPRSGEIGLIAYREGAEAVEVGWGPLAIIDFEEE
jgi:serine/threonine-protein kinase